MSALMRGEQRVIWKATSITSYMQVLSSHVDSTNSSQDVMIEHDQKQRLMTSKPPSPFKTSHIYNRSKKTLHQTIYRSGYQPTRSRHVNIEVPQRKEKHTPFTTTNNINPYHHYPSYPST